MRDVVLVEFFTQRRAIHTQHFCRVREIAVAVLKHFAQQRFFNFAHDQSVQLRRRMPLDLAQVTFDSVARKLAQVLSDLRCFGHRWALPPVMFTVKTAASSHAPRAARIASPHGQNARFWRALEILRLNPRIEAVPGFFCNTPRPFSRCTTLIAKAIGNRSKPRFRRDAALLKIKMSLCINYIPPPFLSFAPCLT